MKHLGTRRRGDELTIALRELPGYEDVGEGPYAIFKMCGGRARDLWLQAGQRLHLDDMKERAEIAEETRAAHVVANMRGALNHAKAFVENPDPDRQGHVLDAINLALETSAVPIPGQLLRLREYAEFVLGDSIVGIVGLYEDEDETRCKTIEQRERLAGIISDFDLTLARGLADRIVAMHSPTVRQGL